MWGQFFTFKTLCDPTFLLLFNTFKKMSIDFLSKLETEPGGWRSSI